MAANDGLIWMMSSLLRLALMGEGVDCARRNPKLPDCLRNWICLVVIVVGCVD